MIREFAGWISDTALSQLFQNVQWIVPVSQSLHIIGLSILFASAIAINFRILGVIKSVRSARQIAAAVGPWMWAALTVVALTGLVQTIAEPLRQFVTPVYWSKLALVAIVVVMTARLLARLSSAAPESERASGPPPGARRVALLSTLIWVCIVVCGRMIGYTFGFYL